ICTLSKNIVTNKERSGFMATQSIMNNIVITEPNAAEMFISALEKAAETAETSTSDNIEYEDVKGEDIKKFLGAFVK
ncbi:MAG: hypothetical protein K2K09_03920, partial [Lachnospiraceae bacterium]|nr:hypothetical protein [Lachnospiraceae bacterium]